MKNKKLKGYGFNAKARKGSNKDIFKEAAKLIDSNDNFEGEKTVSNHKRQVEIIKDDNVETIKDNNVDHSILLDKNVIQKMKMNSKKKKRFEKFLEKELKKDERKKCYEKLSKMTFKASDLLLVSSKKMGSRETRKELLTRSFLEEKAGLAPSNPGFKLIMEEEITTLNSQNNNNDYMIDDDDLESDVENCDENLNEATTPSQSLIAQAFGKSSKEKIKVEVVESTGVGTTTSINEDNTTIAKSIINQPKFGSALKKPSAPIPTLGSALKRKDSSSQKSNPKKHKVENTTPSSESDTSSSDSDYVEQENEIADLGNNSNAKTKEENGQGLWTSDVLNGEQTDCISNNQQKKSKENESKPLIKKVYEQKAKPAYFVPVKRTEDMQIARMALPVVAEEQPIMEAIMANNVTILCGETGSGKTTQVPQFLYEAGFGDKNNPDFPGMVGITQPRRVAAVSMANRVAHEMNLNDGQVTYQVRYDKALLGSNTRIKFMTDGILLRELSSLTNANHKSTNSKGDLLLSQYSCIIIDEAHERTVGTDILIGWLTRIVKLRNSGKIKGIGPLKLVIMSATLRVEDFTLNKSLFPDDTPPPPVVKVDGRQHKVVIHYNKKTPELNYIDDAFKKVVKIHNKLPNGGVLVFVTGMQEVRVLCRKLEKRLGSKKKKEVESYQTNMKDDEEWTRDTSFYDADFDGEIHDDYHEGIEEELADEESDAEEEEVHVLPGSIEDEADVITENEASSPEETRPVHILPLYSLLSTIDQMKVFQPPPEGSRLIIVATNVAETSLTIPGIKYVVDCGKVKERCHDTQTGIQNFKVSWTSNASANQRAGRAGRVGPGHCYRLFSSAVFENYFEKHSRPEILRVPIDGVVLNMKSMGINQVIGFPFPTPPDRFQLQDAEKLLKNLEALSVVDMRISNIGKLMAQFPLSPRYSKMMVVAAKQAPSVLFYVICIVAGLSVGQLFHRDMELIGDSIKKSKDGEEDPNSDSESDFDSLEKEDRKKKRGAFFKTMQIFAGKNPSSDSLMLLRAIGAYLAETNKFGCNQKKLELFCEDHFLRTKALDEVVKLIQQLIHIANSVFGLDMNLKTDIRPPSKKDESLLRQIILSGYIDCVAKLDESTVSGHGKHAIPTYQTMWSIPAEHYVIHPSSCLYRERPAPKWIIYDEVQGKQETYGPDGELLLLRSNSLNESTRMFLKGVTIINDLWLVKQTPSFIHSGKILDQPEPKYYAEFDQVKGFISPTFGTKMWQLPFCEKVLEGKESYGWFAKALLEGEIFFGSSKNKPDNIFFHLKTFLSSKPGILTKSWALNQAKVSELLLALGSKCVNSKMSLLNIWKSETSFLLSAYLLWIPLEFHSVLKKHWPPVTYNTNTNQMDINARLTEAISKLVAMHKKPS